MGKKKDKQRMIEEARMQRKNDKELKIKLRKKMAKGDAFKLTQVYLQYYADFDKELATYKIKLRDVKGDGNCLFRAFADQVDGTQDTHVIMRQEACRYMVAHEQFFEPFLDEDQDGNFKNYINTMKKNGQWGGHLELQALSQCFKCIVVVHKRQREQFNIRPICEQALSVVHLGYFQHEDFQHYVSIRDINDDSDFAALVGLQKLNKNMYNFLLCDDPQQFLLRQQFQEMQIAQKVQQYEQQQKLDQQPYPNYPKTKKCKCGSKLDYKHCCFKQWQIKRQNKLKNK